MDAHKHVKQAKATSDWIERNAKQSQTVQAEQPKTTRRKAKPKPVGAQE